MKKRLFYYSDCIFFGGCENMLVNFLTSDALSRSFDVVFGYRHSTVYEEGLRKRVPGRFNEIPINLPDITGFLSAVPEPSFGPGRVLIKASVRMAELLLKYIQFFIYMVLLFRTFRLHKPDILHINNGGYPAAYSSLAAAIAGRLARIPRILMIVNNIAVPYTSCARLLDYPLDRLVAHSVDLFVTGSRFASEKLKEVLAVADTKITHIPNGIAMRLVTEPRNAVLNRLGIDAGRFILCVVAVLEERKGHVYLFEALTQILESGKPVPHLIVEGSGTHEELLRSYAAQNGLDPFVTFVRADNVFNVMNAADAIVLPSIANEDFPNVILEAMSLQKPVIASRIAGIPEQIEHMKTGIIVEPKDVQGLIDAVVLLMKNKSMRDEIGTQAKEKYLQQYTENVSVGKYITLYNTLIER